MALGLALTVFTELDLEGEVPVASSAEDVRWARDEAGGRWVAKKPSTGDSELLAEAVSWLLARAIGAPVVDASGIWQEPSGSRWWLARLVENVDHWVTDRIPRISNHAQLGLALAVDGVVWNEDRHERNVLLARHPTEDSFEAVAIDFGAAWAGFPPSLYPKGTAPPTSRRLPDDLLTDDVRAHVRQGAQQLAALDGNELWDMATLACRDVDLHHRDLLADVLVVRCRAAVACNADLLG